MNYLKVTAIVNRAALDPVEQALRRLGSGGVSVTPVRGFGEYADFYERDWMTHHLKVEVFTTEDGAQAVARTIMDAAHTGQEDDGIVAILPVLELYRIRTKSLLETPRPQA